MGDEGMIDDGVPKKKARVGELKRVAEIVMVLSAMGEMRGGKDPTALEKALAAEARERLAGVCEEVKPKDLFSREAVRVVVEDLGLNRSRDPMMGFRPPKMSIAEKLLLTKRKMEETKEFASHSSVYSSQLLPVSYGANSESHGTVLHGASKFLPDRHSSLPVSTGSFQSASPAVHVPALTSATSSLKHMQTSEMQPSIITIKSSNGHMERNFPSLVPPPAEATHLRLDARFNGPPYVTQVRATTAASDYLPEKNPATALAQSTSAATSKLGPTNNFLDHSQLKFEGGHVVNTAQPTHQVTRNLEAKTSEIQVAPANLLIGHQPSQGLTFVHGPTFFTNHNDIAKSVQKILQPKFFDHPNWTPPSSEYTNKPLNCQICKIAISDVESLLVCDACEKGTHLKCLQSYGNKGIPKAEWHCPKCLISSNGKLLPPKYGRVTRTIGPLKASSNTIETHASLEKRAENVDSKVHQQKLLPNGNSGLPHLVHVSSMGANHNEGTPDSKTAGAGEMQVLNSPASGMKVVDATNNSIKSAGLVAATLSPQSESSDKGIQDSGSSPSHMLRSESETLLQSKIEPEHSCSGHPENTVIEAIDQSQAQNNSKVGKESEVLIVVEGTNQLHETSKYSADESLHPVESKGIPQDKAGCDVRLQDQVNQPMVPNGNSTSNESKEPSESNAASEYGARCDIIVDDRNNYQVMPDGASNNVDGCKDSGKPSPQELHIVDWVGDALQATEEKTFYQSCTINGVLHKLQDHVLISSPSQKFFPSKLQSLWEDHKTKSKWVTVKPYYFPSDLSDVVSRPSTSENNEVYASNNESTIMASSICGPCEVLPMDKFRGEIDRRTHLKDANNGLHPLFLCRWMYDESKGIFQSIAD